jgi:hypothetical protein
MKRWEKQQGRCCIDNIGQESGKLRKRKKIVKHSSVWKEAKMAAIPSFLGDYTKITCLLS